MKDLCVVTSITRKKGMYNLLEKQLDEAGIDFYTVDQQSDYGDNIFRFCTVENRLNLFQDMVTSLDDYENIVIVDGWDTLFFGKREDVIRNIPKHTVMVAAEKNCYPNISIANDIPDEGTPWRYANFGGMAGTRENLIKFIDEVKRNMHLSLIDMDQEVLNELLAQGKNSTFVLDSNTQIFYCMMEDEGEIVNYNNRPLNVLTDQLPNFIHFNGQSNHSHFYSEFGLAEDKKVIKTKFDYMFCLPGTPSSGTQGISTWLAIYELMALGKSVAIKTASSCNIYLVRNLCLTNKSFQLEQLPFEDYCEDYDRIVFVDSDNYVTSKDILKLTSHDEDIVAAWYVQAPKDVEAIGVHIPATCGVYRDINKPWTVRPFLAGIIPYIKRNEKGLVQVQYSGMGLMVIKKGVFESIGFPWFKSWIKEYEICGVKMAEPVTDDEGFCLRVQEKGFKIFIDPEIKIGHEKLTIH